MVHGGTAYQKNIVVVWSVVVRITTAGFILFEQTCGVLSVLIMRSDTMMHDEIVIAFSPYNYRYGIHNPRSICFFHSGSLWSRGKGHVPGLRSGPFRR